jgi:periplasmic protein TonB
MARRKKRFSTVYVVSVGAHLAVGAILALVPQEKLREVVAIALSEAKKEEKKVEPPKPPEHPPARAAHAPGHNSRPSLAAPVAAAAAGAAAFTDIGLALDSSATDGIAVNIAPPVAPAAPIAAIAPPKPKVLVARRTEVACTEEVIKARPLSMVRPSYTDSARHARAQGRVRIELTVDEHGNVASARVLSGLGFGLDEAAVEAARRLHFSPATQCGRPVAAPFVIAMRFVLPT